MIDNIIPGTNVQNVRTFNHGLNLQLEDIDLESYRSILNEYGLEKTWEWILKELKKYNLQKLNNTFFKFDDIGELYEIALAQTNKIKKKEMGKYYTPTDVSRVMASLLLENEIEVLVDVACGTGNLIIEVIKMINETKKFDIIEFIKKGNLYLYDIDRLALNICVAKIELLLEEQLAEYINLIDSDFLDKNIELPENSSVITNPPYSLIKKFKRSWKKTDVLKQSKDLYAAFMDKILDYCKHAVIVSPQSFLVSIKFSSLRKKLGSNFTGEIYSFDNVPGTLFNGRKHGIFNTNNANGVRASISSIRRENDTGFRLTHLIRFKSDQRKDVINFEFLKSKLGTKKQDLVEPKKTLKELESFVEDILNSNPLKIGDLLEDDPEKQDNRFKINVSTSARYFTVASKKDLNRSGVYEVYAKDEDMFKLIYGLISSSYVYMWWRFFDGGILFTKRWLLKTPVSKEVIEKAHLIFNVVDDMIKNEEKHLTYKKNAGKLQESVKFPIKYRQKLNKILFKDYSKYFELLHRNSEVQ